MDDIFVRLDFSRLEEKHKEHSLAVAEALLKICGMSKIWEEPKHGYRIFKVEVIPEDVPQANLYWIDAGDMFRIPPWGKGYINWEEEGEHGQQSGDGVAEEV
ncbi:hypothetical protein [Paenibacillus cucumis (ex Kampfer et al. 2016)]|uniref:Uncharacterized protein n=1 Tax=Paenibacillus cucumis (ex Kampfer et al. 2016) TaxID=1776858 RepID=A0ABS7KM96_9BACL|nr:hypothetical protein [Paenibacillus cucumis (ex Kampfer et al. 2016)]MBY0205267.1 hypothetical protein [Paenibacillus cucumis (ex Kampfer et al. 2016)]